MFVCLRFFFLLAFFFSVTLPSPLPFLPPLPSFDLYFVFLSLLLVLLKFVPPVDDRICFVFFVWCCGLSSFLGSMHPLSLSLSLSPILFRVHFLPSFPC